VSFLVSQRSTESERPGLPPPLSDDDDDVALTALETLYFLFTSHLSTESARLGLLTLSDDDDMHGDMMLLYFLVASHLWTKVGYSPPFQKCN
jgi:hypothetical protein